MTVIEKPKILDNTPDILDEVWYCVETEKFWCKHHERYEEYVLFKGLVVVWPEKDSDEILAIASMVKKRDHNPRIIEYEDSFGPYITWAQVELEANGRDPHFR